MDLDNSPERILSPEAEALEEAGPKAFGDPMGTPSQGEKVLWKGRPELAVLARTAFHTHTVGLYFAALVVISFVLGNVGTALLCVFLGVLAVSILYGLAWMSARTTLYILTDARLIMRIGMAIETRVNVPLKHVTSADLRARGKTHGDISLSLAGERLLGYALLWPHARPWKFTSPQPMMRSVPEAENVARILAGATAKHARIEQSLTEVNEAPSPSSDNGINEGDLRGAPA